MLYSMPGIIQQTFHHGCNDTPGLQQALHKVAARRDHAVDKRERTFLDQGETQSMTSDHRLEHAKRRQLDLVPRCLQALPQRDVRLDIATSTNTQDADAHRITLPPVKD